ncbi:MAG: DUF6029 family protein [Bacteroidales bacterium]|jgi:hypothetical protein|nr:DUF6029 family protein [Bacteroidales bacterium]
MRHCKAIFILFFLGYISAYGQNTLLQNGKLSGNVQMDAQYYIPDSIIGAEDLENKIRANVFANINYVNGGFSAGFRFEHYEWPLIDFEKINYVGSGIPYYYAAYNHQYFEVVVGSFYEQFGSGLIYRSYESRNLGYDNATQGIKVKAKPYKGITITGVWGKQRNLFVYEGQVRGADADISFTEIFPIIGDSKFRSGIGASFVSKFEKDQDPEYKLPQNIGAFAGRANFGYAGFNLQGEYAWKCNDPSAANEMIYKPGEALLLTASYSMKGLGVFLTGLRTDNFDFRTLRNASINNNIINYIPTLTREHAYALPSMYAYSSQAVGQIGFQAEVTYKIPKKTVIGGKYGTDIMANYSRIHGIKKNFVPEAIATDGTIMLAGTDGYTSPFFAFGKEVYFEDFNIEIGRRFNKSWKLILSYVYLNYNMEVIEGHTGEPNVYTHTVIGDLTYKINDKHALRLELQHMNTKQDDGNWMYAQLEYSIAPRWFFSVLDRWNYGNPEKEKQVHYYNVSTSFVHKTSKFSLSFGKQYEGILCVGGVCRVVPASYGCNLSIVTGF